MAKITLTIFIGFLIQRESMFLYLLIVQDTNEHNRQVNLSTFPQNDLKYVDFRSHFIPIYISSLNRPFSFFSQLKALSSMKYPQVIKYDTFTCKILNAVNIPRKYYCKTVTVLYQSLFELQTYQHGVCSLQHYHKAACSSKGEPCKTV